MQNYRKKSVTIVGGGIIGLSIGWQLAKKGLKVTIFDRGKVGRSASWTAAGMLSPLAEVNAQEVDLLRLGLESAASYPKWIEELENDSGISVDFRTDGTLIVALDRDDESELRYHFELQNSFELPVKWLSGSEVRKLEPSLSPRVTSAIDCLGDRQVDNRLVVEALKRSFLKFGGKLCENTPVEKIEIQSEKSRSENSRAIGIWVGGELISTDEIVIAAGSWSSEIKGVTEKICPPIRPIKGQVIILKMENIPLLNRVIHAPDAYLVPKSDGRLMVGATSEEQGFDTEITAGGVFELLRGAWEVLPGIYDLPIVETSAGLRPCTRNNFPIIGRARQVENLLMATGHYRKGILLAPITAQKIKEAIIEETIG